MQVAIGKFFCVFMFFHWSC